MDCRPKCKTQNCHTPKDNIEENLGDLGFGDTFLDTTPKALLIKEKIDKLDFINIKNYSVKDTKRIKRQATEWERIFATQS